MTDKEKVDMLRDALTKSTLLMQALGEELVRNGWTNQALQYVGDCRKQYVNNNVVLTKVLSNE